MELIFREKHQQTDDIWTFTFEPREPVSWLAGQSLRLEIPGPYGQIEHRFSISSMPSTYHIAVTTRLSGSDYKDSLASLQPGNTVFGYEIRGDTIWHDTETPHIYVAAGVGVVPFHAIIGEQSARGLTTPTTLLYSSREQPALFEYDLKKWRTAIPGLDVRFYRERVTARQILNLPGARERRIYISGPSKMVSALSTDLVAAGISPAQITQDLFTGRLSLDG